MNIQPSITDLNKERNSSSRFILLALFLLATNYLIYNFFQNDRYKDVVRIIAVAIIIVSGFIYHSYNSIGIKTNKAILIYLAFIQLVVMRNSDINFFVIVLCSIFSTVEYDSYIKGLNKFTMVLLIVVVISLQFGWVDNVKYISTTGRLRQTLGFENVNAGSLFFFSANLIYLINCKKIGFKNFLLSIIYTVLIYRLTDTRTSIIGIILFFASLYLIKLLKNSNKITFCIIFLLVTLLYSSVFLWNLIYIKFPGLNEILSSRLHLFNSAISVARASGMKNFLFGGIRFSNYDVFVDNFYILLLYQNGIFIYFLTYVFSIFSVKKLLNAGLYREVALIISLLAVGIVESSMIRPEITSVMLAWRCIFNVESIISVSQSVKDGENK